MLAQLDIAPAAINVHTKGCNKRLVAHTVCQTPTPCYATKPFRDMYKLSNALFIIHFVQTVHYTNPIVQSVPPCSRCPCSPRSREPPSAWPTLLPPPPPPELRRKKSGSRSGDGGSSRARRSSGGGGGGSANRTSVVRVRVSEKGW